jgi:hypothetical protein
MRSSSTLMASVIISGAPWIRTVLSSIFWSNENSRLCDSSASYCGPTMVVGRG